MGRDEEIQKYKQAVKDFYSHALVGRDLNLRMPLLLQRISTHTPSWGVTVRQPPLLPVQAHFYSHALVGRDGLWQSIANGVVNFYSHALVGRDGEHMKKTNNVQDFYSHALVGRDRSTLQCNLFILEFLLTRPRGA